MSQTTAIVRADAPAAHYVDFTDRRAAVEAAKALQMPLWRRRREFNGKVCAAFAVGANVPEHLYAFAWDPTAPKKERPQPLDLSPEECEDLAHKIREALREEHPSLRITVAAAGRWLWITGETREAAETLKAHGARWSTSKTAWYVAGSGCCSRGGATLGFIADRYGMKEIEA